MPNYQANVSENWNEHAKLAPFLNVYQNKFPKECKDFFVRLCMQGDMQTFLLLNFQVKWKRSMFDTKKYEEKRNKTKCIQKIDKNWKNKVWDNLFDQGLKDVKDKEDKKSWKS